MIQISFQLALWLYTLALILSFFKHKPAVFIFGTGLVCNAVSLVLRYWSIFPMLPLFQGPFFIPFVLGTIGFSSLLGAPGLQGVGLDNAGSKRAGGRLLIFMVAGLSWVTYLFPNDFYLPLLQFRTPFFPRAVHLRHHRKGVFF